ncbi:hypothetical protein LJ721_004711 [Salmonella enterica]|nr:hypothetical protein [Salmonella enterica]
MQNYNAAASLFLSRINAIAKRKKVDEFSDLASFELNQSIGRPFRDMVTDAFNYLVDVSNNNPFQLNMNYAFTSDDLTPMIEEYLSELRGDKTATNITSNALSIASIMFGARFSIFCKDDASPRIYFNLKRSLITQMENAADDLKRRKSMKNLLLTIC